MLVGAVGEATSAVGVVLVISVVHAVLELPAELMQASTELASVLMSCCGTVAVVEPLEKVVLTVPVLELTSSAAFRKACARPEAAQAVVALLTTVQVAVAALFFAGALMLTTVERRCRYRS